jgi:hypothetical protein
MILPPFLDLDIGCIVFGTHIKKHTLRETYTDLGKITSKLLT